MNEFALIEYSNEHVRGSVVCELESVEIEASMFALDDHLEVFTFLAEDIWNAFELADIHAENHDPGVRADDADELPL